MKRKINIEATVVAEDKCHVDLEAGDAIVLKAGPVVVATYKAKRKVTITNALIFDSPMGYGGLFEEVK